MLARGGIDTGGRTGAGTGTDMGGAGCEGNDIGIGRAGGGRDKACAEPPDWAKSAAAPPTRAEGGGAESGGGGAPAAGGGALRKSERAASS